MTLAICGWVGQAFFTTTQPGLNLFSAFWESTASWELAALPLFIWMGEILFRTRLSEEMFDGSGALAFGRVPGRLMHTTILGCGIFGSVSGSSAATCATIAKVALPELDKRGYDEKIALGSLATAGTLGILIPPSITMVVYAVAADASIIRLFLAGFLPGFVLMALFSGYIIWWSAAQPGCACRRPKRPPRLAREAEPLAQPDSLRRC
jgi:tripartite ATP-independent transporter DctM subunit